VGSEVGLVNVATKRTTPLEKKEASHTPFGKEWNDERVVEKAKKKAKKREVEGRLGAISRDISPKVYVSVPSVGVAIVMGYVIGIIYCWLLG
jgi:hypothetical protein